MKDKQLNTKKRSIQVLRYRLSLLKSRFISHSKLIIPIFLLGFLVGFVSSRLYPISYNTAGHFEEDSKLSMKHETINAVLSQTSEKLSTNSSDIIIQPQNSPLANNDNQNEVVNSTDSNTSSKSITSVSSETTPSPPTTNNPTTPIPTISTTPVPTQVVVTPIPVVSEISVTLPQETAENSDDQNPNKNERSDRVAKKSQQEKKRKRKQQEEIRPDKSSDNVQGASVTAPLWLQIVYQVQNLLDFLFK